MASSEDENASHDLILKLRSTALPRLSVLDNRFGLPSQLGFVMWAFVGDIVLFDPVTFTVPIDNKAESNTQIELPTTIGSKTAEIAPAVDLASRTG